MGPYPSLDGMLTGGQPRVSGDGPLAAAVAESAMAVGQGDDVTAVAPGSGAGHFEGFDNVICRRIQKLILGQTLTTDASTGGSLAAARVAEGVRMDRRNADLRLVGATVQRLVNALWEFNGRGECPVFVLADDTGLEKERAERDAILTEKVGVRLTPGYIADRYDLEPADFTMAEPAPVASPAPSPADPTATFSARKREFTPVQQGIEDALADLSVPDPIAPELVRAAVLAARDEDDLRARLSALVPQTDPRFAQAMERASFAAAVLGYVAAEERRA